MGGFKLGGMTLGSLFKKPETVLYPLENKPVPAGLKGVVEIDTGACILCGICSKRCPCAAIEVDKKTREWSINRFQCVQCGTCIQECPKHCLVMDPQRPGVATSMGWHRVNVPDPKAAAKAESAE